MVTGGQVAILVKRCRLVTGHHWQSIFRLVTGRHVTLLAKCFLFGFRSHVTLLAKCFLFIYKSHVTFLAKCFLFGYRSHVTLLAECFFFGDRMSNGDRVKFVFGPDVIPCG